MRSHEAAERYRYRFEETDEFSDPGQMIRPIENEAGEPQFDGTICDAGKPGKGFWRRQFRPGATAAQRRVDWVLGVILPLICFYFDPIVFRSSGGFEAPMFGKFRMAAYVMAFVSIMAMAAWLLWGEKLNWLSGWLGGIFLAGAAVSFVVGLALLPISLIGLIVLIGALGFTPMLTAFVYFRNAFRSIDVAKGYFDTRTLNYVILLGAMIATIVPYVIYSSSR